MNPYGCPDCPFVYHMILPIPPDGRHVIHDQKFGHLMVVEPEGACIPESIGNTTDELVNGVKRLLAGWRP